MSSCAMVLHPTLLLAGLLLLLQVTILTYASESSDGSADAPDLFAQRVWPLLSAKCLSCHGNGEELKGHLDLRTPEAALNGGESGRALVLPGMPEESLIYIAVAGLDPELAMPPKENDRLTNEEIGWLKEWIAKGGDWLDEEARRKVLAEESWTDEVGVKVTTSGGLSEEWSNRRYLPENLWAYQPLKKAAVPFSSPHGIHPIDAFIDRKIAERGLEAAPLADRRTLLRRATYDLIGLPPTPEELDAFVTDPAPDEEAFARVLERLLASPHYGEQWARHWLDVVRYADSSGLANDFERPNAWRYRDYVIRAFNEDKPFDRFMREQIAGDELDPADPEMLIAVGFLRMGPWELTGMEVPKVARHKFLDDITDMVGQVFLSHPLQCARCHDHKFDPIPTRDYYSLQAVFATTQFAGREAAFLPHENTNRFDEGAILRGRIQQYEEMLRAVNAKEQAAARAWYRDRGLPYISRAAALKKGLPEDQIAPRHIGLTAEDLGRERIARKTLSRLRWELDRYEPIAFSVYSGKTPQLRNVASRLKMPADPESAGELEHTAILAGGDPFSPTMPVDPGVLSVVNGTEASIPDRIAGRRTALAQWLSDESNPLPARSMANRIWSYHFGRGIAGNPNNFGAMGKKPTHPELLDWLASRFVEKGWSVKSMHRLIMMSETYRRSSSHPDGQSLREKDPEGETYAAFRPRRVSAEELRDSLLMISGELNRELGGIPIRPEMELEIALQPRQIMGTYAPAYQPSPLPSDRHRRSIYALRWRGLRDPWLEVFNQPEFDLSCEARDASIITPQVFSLFNSADSYRRSAALARRLLNKSSTRHGAIERAIQLVYGRSAHSEELRLLLEHWEEMKRRHEAIDLVEPSYPRAVTREFVDENTGETFKLSERLDMYDRFVPDPSFERLDPEARGLAEVCLVLFNSNEFIFVY